VSGGAAGVLPPAAWLVACGAGDTLTSWHLTVPQDCVGTTIHSTGHTPTAGGICRIAPFHPPLQYQHGLPLSPGMLACIACVPSAAGGPTS
jgi:hypothetical protein